MGVEDINSKQAHPIAIAFMEKYGEEFFLKAKEVNEMVEEILRLRARINDIIGEFEGEETVMEDDADIVFAEEKNNNIKLTFKNFSEDGNLETNSDKWRQFQVGIKDGSLYVDAFDVQGKIQNFKGGTNSYFGYKALDSVPTLDDGLDSDRPEENIAYGRFALEQLTKGNNNTAVGSDAGQGLEEGDNNTFIGRNSGKGITEGSGNTIIGPYNEPEDLDENVIIADGVGNPVFRKEEDGLVTLPTQTAELIENSESDEAAVNVEYLQRFAARKYVIPEEITLNVSADKTYKYRDTYIARFGNFLNYEKFIGRKISIHFSIPGTSEDAKEVLRITKGITIIGIYIDTEAEDIYLLYHTQTPVETTIPVDLMISDFGPTLL